jgi:hypothetical protein
MSASSRREFVHTLTRRAGAGLALVALAPAVSAASATPAASAPPTASGLFNIRDFGATGDGSTKDTTAIQAAIDACTQAGGGVVYLPPGRYFSGTITLKDNVTLHLAASATLFGSNDRADYPAKPFPARDLDIGGFEIWTLIYADGATNIRIEGPGIIDGNGRDFPPLPKMPSLDLASGPRPRGIFLKNCRHVTVRDVQILHPACWALHLAVCDGAVLENLYFLSHYHYNQDGIVLDSCRNITVTNCRLDTLDDCIVFKASFPQPCEAITVSGCILTSDCTAIKFGTQSLGGFRAIAISNCVIYKCQLGGVKFETMDGGTLEDVTVSNLTMTGVTAPLFFRIGNRGQDYGFKDVARPRPIGILRNVLVTGIRATLTTQTNQIGPHGRFMTPQQGGTMIIAGLPGHPVEGVTLADIHVTCPGGGTAADAARRDIPDAPALYPENDMFGVLPSYGFYLRHVRGLTMRNVRLELATPDLRPALIADDTADLELDGFKAAITGAAHFARLIQTRDAVISHCRPLGPVDTFVSVEGNQSAGIALLANNLQLASHAVKTTADAPPHSVQQSGNLGPR